MFKQFGVRRGLGFPLVRNDLHDRPAWITIFSPTWRHDTRHVSRHVSWIPPGARAHPPRAQACRYQPRARRDTSRPPRLRAERAHRPGCQRGVLHPGQRRVRGGQGRPTRVQAHAQERRHRGGVHLRRVRHVMVSHQSSVNALRSTPGSSDPVKSSLFFFFICRSYIEVI